jgi:hypothetical protein
MTFRCNGRDLINGMVIFLLTGIFLSGCSQTATPGPNIIQRV